MTRFDLDMDGSMEPSEHGRWVRYEDAQQEPVKSGGGASATVTITLPAQRTWVGLTDEDIDELFEYGLAFERPRVIYREIEAKLKEKNNG